MTVLFGNDGTEVKENYSILCAKKRCTRLGSYGYVPFSKDISLTFKLEHSFMSVGAGHKNLSIFEDLNVSSSVPQPFSSSLVSKQAIILSATTTTTTATTTANTSTTTSTSSTTSASTTATTGIPKLCLIYALFDTEVA